MSKKNSPKILIIDDEEDVHYSFERLFDKEPVEILTASNGDTGLKIARKDKPSLVVMDIRMNKENGLDVLRDLKRINPRQLVIMMTAYGTSQTAIEAMKLGAFDYVLKPFDIPQLKELITRALEAAHAQEQNMSLPVKLEQDDFQTGIVGAAHAMQQVYKLVGQVSPTDATALITGESGTGKELVARAIYSNSKRSQKTFIAINCAAIPENLLESELFGHEKGSFTGAVSQRIGKFEQCDGGTLFLDEIGEMPMPIQSKLLRVLQDGEFTRVGGNQTLKTDVRIIAATNRNLWEASQKREFREDLYYRLNVVTIKMPSLRERLDDLTTLVSYFINKWRARHSGGANQIADEALEVLRQYRWPGNVRELENCIQRAMVLASGDTILAQDLPFEIVQAAGPLESAELSHHSDKPASNGASQVTTGTSVNSIDQAYCLLFDHARSDNDLKLLPAIERDFIIRALELTGGNQVKASEMLGITRATLRKRVEKFSIQKTMRIS
ncbi:MAG: sigma-54 dependent transcriptional regulator [Verrucomicrobiota bacterium]